MFSINQHHLAPMLVFTHNKLAMSLAHDFF